MQGERLRTIQTTSLRSSQRCHWTGHLHLRQVLLSTRKAWVIQNIIRYHNMSAFWRHQRLQIKFFSKFFSKQSRMSKHIIVYGKIISRTHTHIYAHGHIYCQSFKCQQKVKPGMTALNLCDVVMILASFVVFHSYASLPEGNFPKQTNPVFYPWFLKGIPCDTYRWSISQCHLYGSTTCYSFWMVNPCQSCQSIQKLSLCLLYITMIPFYHMLSLYVVFCTYLCQCLTDPIPRVPWVP